MDCRQMVPGPVSDTRWWPSAPMYRLTMPGSRITEKLHAVVEQADVARVHEERLAVDEVEGRHLTRELDPRLPLALELLEDEALAAPEAAAERLLQCHRGRDPRRAAYPAVAMDDESVARSDVDREDPTGDLAGEGHHGRAAGRLVAGQQEAPAPRHALQASHDPPTSAGAGSLGELHVARHPRQVAMGGDDGLTRIEHHLKDRHRGALDVGLHRTLLSIQRGCPPRTPPYAQSLPAHLDARSSWACQAQRPHPPRPNAPRGVVRGSVTQGRRLGRPSE